MRLRHLVRGLLEMARSHDAGTAVDLPRPRTDGYTQFPSEWSLVGTTVLNQSRAAAAGDLVSTPGDLGRFFGALLGGCSGPPSSPR
jgi:D-alanyl-D-alanine carboxypeptidase